MNEVAVAAEAAAATESRLLASKETIRTATTELSERRRELICKLLDDIYQLGFTAGVDYLGHHILDSVSLPQPSSAEEEKS